MKAPYRIATISLGSNKEEILNIKEVINGVSEVNGKQ